MADHGEIADHSVLWFTLQEVRREVSELAECTYGTHPCPFLYVRETLNNLHIISDRTPEQVCFWITNEVGKYKSGRIRCGWNGGVPAEVYSAEENHVVQYV